MKKIPCELENRQVENTRTIFSVLLALSPVLSIYHSGIPGLNAADFAFFLIWLFFFCLVLKRRVGIRCVIDIIPRYTIFLCCFIVHVIALLLYIGFISNNTQKGDVLIRTTRIVYYFATILLVTPTLLNKTILIKAIQFISLIAAIYLLIQVVIYRLNGTVLRGFFPFLPLYFSEYESIDYSSFYNTFFHRPTSFFLEPAHFSRYISLGLASFLFEYPKNKKWARGFLAALFLSFTIVLSTSSIGFMLMCFLWGLFILDMFHKLYLRGQVRIIAYIIMLVTLIVYIVYLFSPEIQFVISRTLDFGKVSAYQSRLGSILEVFGEPSLLLIFFGHGYGSVPEVNTWMSGFTYILYGSGLIGVCMILLYHGLSFIHSKKSALNRVYVIIFLLLLLVDDSFNSVVVIMLYSLTYGSTRRVKLR